MDDKIKIDLRRLTKTRPVIPPLDPAPAPAPILPRTALGRAAATSRSQAASPIASLTEVDATARTFHPDRTVSTPDGVFSFSYHRLHVTDMVTDTGTVIPFEYGDPDA